MALVSPVAMPAFFASSTLARTPVATTTRSAEICSPPTDTPATFSVPRISSTPFPTMIRKPFCSSISCTCLAMSASSIAGRTCGSNSTTVVFSPRSTKAMATSSPISPPPMTTADSAPAFMALSILSPSPIVLTTYTPCFSLPFIGGTKANAPVAIIKLS